MLDAVILVLTPWPIMLVAVGLLLAGTQRAEQRDIVMHNADARP